jgi:cAMP-binding proteins - catabolite gene activator and regulatory subunit of cAMP-dependent protein kinases
MQEITSRWLLKVLPWVEATGGTYRVNQRRSYAVGDGRVTFTNVGADVQVIPQELGELPLLRGLDDTDVLTALAEQFVQQEFEAGDVLVEAGQPADQVFLIAHGKVDKIGPGKYGTPPCSTPWPTAVTSAIAHWSSRATPGPSPPRPSPAAPC